MLHHDLHAQPAKGSLILFASMAESCCRLKKYLNDASGPCRGSRASLSRPQDCSGSDQERAPPQRTCHKAWRCQVLPARSAQTSPLFLQNTSHTSVTERRRSSKTSSAQSFSGPAGRLTSRRAAGLFRNLLAAKKAS